MAHMLAALSNAARSPYSRACTPPAQQLASSKKHYCKPSNHRPEPAGPGQPCTQRPSKAPTASASACMPSMNRSLT
uniref:Uncharacterized protein n=1 Tax=Arundo donax TaxID=35708 RepID=A0A0A8ZHV2_ARUDO